MLKHDRAHCNRKPCYAYELLDISCYMMSFVCDDFIINFQLETSPTLGSLETSQYVVSC